MEKKKSIAQGMGQMGKNLGKWEDEGRGNNDRQLVMPRSARRTTFNDSSPPSAADRRGRMRADEDEDSLVNAVKAFSNKTTETVDKYEEARKKSKINRFFKGVRGIFPKSKKKKGEKDKKDKRSNHSSSSSDSEEDKAARYSKQERKEREIGGGKFQEKERKRREEEERKRQNELEARRKQRKASATPRDEDDETGESEGEDAERLEDKRQMRKQEHLLKRSQSTPASQHEKEEAIDRPKGIREKYKAKLEAKKAAALAELHKEEAEKEQERQRQAAKAEEAAIDSFLERAAQRRRGTEERVGFRSKRASIDKGKDHGSGDEEEEDDDIARRRRVVKEQKKVPKEEKGKEVGRAASARTHKKVTSSKAASEPQLSGSVGSIATSAAIGGAKLVGRYVQQRLVDEYDQEESDEGEEEESEEEVERAHRWKDRERERKVKERIEETRRQRQAQAQGRRPSLGKSYSWASPRSGDIPVPMSSHDRMMAAIEGAAARNSPVATPSPCASPRRANGGGGNGNGGSGDRTIWHRKARVIRERSQRNLGGSKGEMRTTSEHKLG